MKVPAVLTNIGFNQRQLTLADFEIICAQLKILVFYTNSSFDGVSFPRRERRIIVLKENLSGIKGLLVAWHELFHHLCGHEGIRFFLPNCVDKAELEADLLSLCAVIPKLWLKSKNVTELLEEGFTWELLWQRKEIYERYKI